jgi:hypothetical protein
MLFIKIKYYTKLSIRLHHTRCRFDGLCLPVGIDDFEFTQSVTLLLFTFLTKIIQYFPVWC